MEPLSVVALVAVALICGGVALWRVRRTRYLLTNRPKVIEQSLERARAKQEHHRWAPGPREEPHRSESRRPPINEP